MLPEPRAERLTDEERAALVDEVWAHYLATPPHLKEAKSGVERLQRAELGRLLREESEHRDAATELEQQASPEFVRLPRDQVIERTARMVRAGYRNDDDSKERLLELAAGHAESGERTRRELAALQIGVPDSLMEPDRSLAAPGRSVFSPGLVTLVVADDTLKPKGRARGLFQATGSERTLFERTDTPGTWRSRVFDVSRGTLTELPPADQCIHAGPRLFTMRYARSDERGLAYSIDAASMKIEATISFEELRNAQIVASADGAFFGIDPDDGRALLFSRDGKPVLGDRSIRRLVFHPSRPEAWIIATGALERIHLPDLRVLARSPISWRKGERPPMLAFAPRQDALLVLGDSSIAVRALSSLRVLVPVHDVKLPPREPTAAPRIFMWSSLMGPPPRTGVSFFSDGRRARVQTRIGAEEIYDVTPEGWNLLPRTGYESLVAELLGEEEERAERDQREWAELRSRTAAAFCTVGNEPFPREICPPRVTRPAHGP